MQRVDLMQSRLEESALESLDSDAGNGGAMPEQVAAAQTLKV